MKQPKWMPRKLYKIADISSPEKQYIPGMSVLGGNLPSNPKISTVTDDIVKRAALLICYGKSIAQCAVLFKVNESELRNRLRLWSK